MNFAFNCSNNLAFGHVFKYIGPGVGIPSATTLTRHLKLRESLRWMIFEHVYLLQERFLWLPIHGLHRTKLFFLAIVAYWNLDSLQMEEVLIGFEEIRRSHKWLIWQG